MRLKRLDVIAIDRYVDSGEFFVENQAYPYKYPDLRILIDTESRPGEYFLDLVLKAKLRTYGVFKAFWMYRFEPSEEFAHIVLERLSDEGEDPILWSTRCEQGRITDDKIGVIIHTHRLSELSELVPSLNKERLLYEFKKFKNVYLKGLLHETVIEERVHFFVFNEKEEAEFLSKIQQNFDLFTTK